MPSRLETEADLKAGLAKLVERDARMADLLAVGGAPPLRRRAAGFAGLASIVCAQQLSTASASAIWGRLVAKFDPFDHHAVLSARTPTLKRAGLSAPKIKTFRNVARAVRDKSIDLDALGSMPADDAHAALVTISG